MLLRRSGPLLLLVLLLGGLLAVGCGDERPAAPRGGAPENAGAGPGASEDVLASGPSPELTEFLGRTPPITLLLAGGQLGKLKPCGCSKPQLGGPQRLAFLKELLEARTQRGRGSLTALSLGWTLKGSGEAQEEAKADFIRAVYEELGFSGILLGDTDLLVDAMCQPRGSGPSSGDSGVLGGLEAPRPPINVRLAPGNPAAESASLLELQVRTLRLRVCSFLEPGRADDLKSGGVLDVVTSANGAFGGLSPDPDVLWIVALWLREPATLDALRSELSRLGPAIIVVLNDAAGDSSVDRAALGSGRAPLVLSLSEMGKSAGVLDLEEDKQAGGWLASWRRVDLDPGMDVQSSAAASAVRTLDGFYRQVVRERNYLREFPRFPDDAVRYVGSSACAHCHGAIYSDWRQSPHGQALPTLREANYDWDPECIRCHVVGWDRLPDGRWYVRDSSFRDPERTPFLGGVGCENCHGPGSAHVADPWNRDHFSPAGVNRRAPDRADCQKCHDPENSVDFLSRTDWYMSNVSHRNVPRDRRTVMPPGKPAYGGEGNSATGPPPPR